MNIEDTRQGIAEAIAEVTPEAWQITTATDPDVYTGLIQVGHATEIRVDQFGGFSFGMPITAWINEADSGDHVRDLYALLSMADGSLLQFFTQSEFKALEIEDASVEPRQKGPTMYLVAEVTVRLAFDTDI